MTFEQLGLAEPLTRALTEEGYTAPTPIQERAIPNILAGTDVIGIAQTGTGKTAAFTLPILNHLALNRSRPEPRACRVLILSPTRELSGQIRDSIQAYGRHTRPTLALVIGGVPIKRQAQALARGVDILVATPGRLRDLMQSGSVRLDQVEVFVLDEADRMLDIGFIHDIRAIAAKLPYDRQTLLFSATMPRSIVELAEAMLKNPVQVAVTPESRTADRVDQQIYLLDRAQKIPALANILRAEDVNRALVFTRTKRGADQVVKSLAVHGVEAAAIHGNKSQNNRERALEGFRSGKVRTLVATDIAARGIDVDGVSHVVNFNLPEVPETYVHRIGRTARAGADGIAISFCDGEDRALLAQIEKSIKMRLPVEDRRSAEAREAPLAGDVSRPQKQQQRGGRPGNSGRPSQAGSGRPSQGNGARQAQRPAGQAERPSGQTRPEQGFAGLPRSSERPAQHGAGKPGANRPGKPFGRRPGNRAEVRPA